MNTKITAITLLLLCFIHFRSTAQADTTTQSIGAFLSTLPVNPLKIFNSRIKPKFQTKADTKFSISFNYGMGNVWLPYVEAFLPKNEADRQKMNAIDWHKRIFAFDTLNSDAEKISYQADGIIREYQIGFNYSFAKNHEIFVNNRFYSIDGGNTYNSLFTSDQFIEWFHSNVAGGEDPFSRKIYGLNKAYVNYKDENNRHLQIKNGDFFYSGTDICYYYYPQNNWFKKINLFTNIGIQLGINKNRASNSLDFGMQNNTMKSFKITKTKHILLGVNLAYMHNKAVLWQEKVNLSNRNTHFNFELLIEYQKRFKNGKILSLATNYYYQNAQRTPTELNYAVLDGKRYTAHWNHAIKDNYRPMTAHALIAGLICKNTAIAIYLREDLLTDNAPDMQIGIGIKQNIF